jgi:predicted enzyme related to lactoylglutathione lyase
VQKDTYDNGVPSWVDLGSPDVEKAAVFYSGLFGWKVQEGVAEAGGYRICEIGGRPVAGLGPQMNPGPPAWMTYVNVDDATDAAEKVTAAGGQVFMAPMEVLDVGRMAVFADTGGAVLGLWQPGTHKGAGLVNEPNTYCWSELNAIDLDGAKTFYNAVFGWGSATQEAGGVPGGYTEWKLGDARIAGMLRKPESIPAEVPPFWLVYFAVADADASTKAVAELGGTAMMPPTDVEPGRLAVVADPSGATFGVIQLKDGMGG